MSKIHVYCRDRTVSGGNSIWLHSKSCLDIDEAYDHIEMWMTRSDRWEFVTCEDGEDPSEVAANIQPVEIEEDAETDEKEFRVDYHFEDEGWLFGSIDDEFDDLADAIKYVDKQLSNAVHTRPVRIVRAATGEPVYARDDWEGLDLDEFVEVEEVLYEPVEEAFVESMDEDETEDLPKEEVHIPSDEEVYDPFAYGLDDHLTILSSGRTGRVIKRVDNGYGLQYVLKMDDDAIVPEVVPEVGVAYQFAQYYVPETAEPRKGLIRRIVGGTLGLVGKGARGTGKGVVSGTKGLAHAAGSGLKMGFNLTKLGVKYAAIGVVAAGVLSGGTYAVGETVKVLSNYDENPVVRGVVNVTEEVSEWVDS